MNNIKVSVYEKNKYTNYIENNSDKNIEKNDLEERLLGVLGLFDVSYEGIEINDIVISSKITSCAKEKNESYNSDEKLMKFILNDSWTLAECIDQEISHSNIVNGLAYCSANNFL
ncbi:hypothetical protein NNC19_18925 [Clostridium sp. SHJSY1]|uniref:hypothetical protein n=1 Tax=Clostridium sp. SHJSY1 TaxID=2942483 RepID=UPI002876BB27|nr:hypothetical protein [Clostridium sp. SHJSY1]MDS0527768.1 hypothetical protein [Clostridium sp. SHJSY1]